MKKRSFTEKSINSDENKRVRYNQFIEGHGLNCHRQFEIISVLHTSQKVDSKSIKKNNLNFSSNLCSPCQSLFSTGADNPLNQIEFDKKLWMELINLSDTVDNSTSYSNLPIDSDLISELSVNSSPDGAICDIYSDKSDESSCSAESSI